ncbi:MAG: hypothetical protein AAGE18_08305 [Pseudomonadota bacterium]
MPGLSPRDRLDGLALLIMRFGIGWFIFVWAVNKIIVPQQYVELVQWIDQVEISLAQVYLVASLQVLVCLLVFAGAFRIFSYGTLLVIHGFTIYRELPRYLAPFEINDRGFPVNRNLTDSLAVFAAMIALLLLINRDHISVGGWLRRNWDPDAWWA